MTRHPMASLGALSLALTVALSGAGCGVGLEDFPLPAPGIGGDSYTLHASFTNALNLPDGAKVRLGGADVGEVTGMAVRDYTAVVTMRISSTVSLPAGTHAALRTATPLGDVFVAVLPPAGATAAAPDLGDGDSIPVASTSAAATIEEVLATASLLVNGGVIRDITKVVNGLGAAAGDRGERLGALIARTTEFVRALAARSEAIRRTLAETDRLTALLNERRETLDEVFAAASPALSVVADNTQQALDLIQQVNRISREVAKFPSMRGTDTRSMIADIDTIAAELDRAATDPDADFAQFNRILGPVLKLTNGTSAHVDVDLADIAIGAVPDPGHFGDPGSRAPDASDWANFAGAFTYTMMRLHDRVLGPGR
ncbi:MCE family protein [Nocardia higoensis]|uniref:MCE family protein n=1 Tax=Nocardia higoensis TaxID=228599 RepID=UPI0002D429A7|nr:MCE family protein [Nocardia higoensis]